MKIDFLENKNIRNLISGLLFISSIISIVLFRFNFGFQFSGGTVAEYKFAESIKVGELVNMYLEKDVNAVDIIKTEQSSYLVYTKQLENEEISELSNLIKQEFSGAEQIGVETVGLMVEKGFLIKFGISLILTLISAGLFFLYVFRNLGKKYSSPKFSLCAIAAVIYDIVVISGILSFAGRIFGMEIIPSFLAISFAVIIFSIFSKYYLFKRIKENLLTFDKEGFSNVLNFAFTENLPEAVNFTTAVIVVLMPVIFFGGRHFQHSAIFLSAGAIISIYSNLFVSSQLLLLFEKKSLGLKNKKRKRR